MKRILLIIVGIFVFCNTGLSQDSTLFRQGVLDVFGGPVRFFSSNSAKNYFRSGFSAGLAFYTYTSKFVSLRFGASYCQVAFEENNYPGFDSLSAKGYSVETSPLCFLTISQDLKVAPRAGRKFSPYIIGGLSGVQGISEGRLRVQNESRSSAQDNKYPAGFRLLFNIGAGIQYSLSERFNLLLEAKQHMEFFENSHSENLFYQYKEDYRGYNYLNLTAGISYKLKQ